MYCLGTSQSSHNIVTSNESVATVRNSSFKKLFFVSIFRENDCWLQRNYCRQIYLPGRVSTTFRLLGERGCVIASAADRHVIISEFLGSVFIILPAFIRRWEIQTCINTRLHTRVFVSKISYTGYDVSWFAWWIEYQTTSLIYNFNVILF
jgi:hypothetical protein